MTVTTYLGDSNGRLKSPELQHGVIALLDGEAVPFVRAFRYGLRRCRM